MRLAVHDKGLIIPSPEVLMSSYFSLKRDKINPRSLFLLDSVFHHTDIDITDLSKRAYK